jgi:tRNA nucleotidyltransferase (CCA-adding enzyme)
LESVKHVSFVLSMLSSILTHPFVTASLPLLLSSVKALQALVLNTWPRMHVYKTEVLKCAGVAWIRIEQEGGEGFEEIKQECRTTVQMLKDALGENKEFEAEVAEMVKVDGRLEGLFTE